MNYFDLYIGDYQLKTAHLTLAEHGAYFLLLQHFYSTEKPLPSDHRVLYRLVRAESKSERDAVDSVLSQFWDTTPEGYLNKRARQVLSKYQEWIAKQRANGKLGGNPGKSHGVANGRGNA